MSVTNSVNAVANERWLTIISKFFSSGVLDSDFLVSSCLDVLDSRVYYIFIKKETSIRTILVGQNKIDK